MSIPLLCVARLGAERLLRVGQCHQGNLQCIAGFLMVNVAQEFGDDLFVFSIGQIGTSIRLIDSNLDEKGDSDMFSSTRLSSVSHEASAGAQ